MRIYLSIALVLAACSLPALGSSCTTTPCTGSSSTGQDTTDRNDFESNSSSIVGSTLTFSNLTFDNGTFTIGSGGSVLDSGLTFIGCLANWSDCTSNSSGVTVGNSGTFWNGSKFLNWDGGNDPILSGPAGNGPGQMSTITISIPLSANIFAIGLDILNNNNSASTTPYGVIVNGGSQYNTATQVQYPGSVFFGYSSASAITSLTIFSENSSTTLGIDNIDVGSLTLASGSGSGGGTGSSDDPSTTPEASTMLLVGSGFFMLRFARKLPCFSR